MVKNTYRYFLIILVIVFVLISSACSELDLYDKSGDYYNGQTAYEILESEYEELKQEYQDYKDEVDGMLCDEYCRGFDEGYDEGYYDGTGKFPEHNYDEIFEGATFDLEDW